MSRRPRHKQQRSSLQRKALEKAKRAPVADEDETPHYADALVVADPFSRAAIPVEPLARVHKKSPVVDFWSSVWAWLLDLLRWNR